MAQDGAPAGSGTDATQAHEGKSYGASVGRWSGYVRELFMSSNGPPLGSVDPDKIEQAAREKLKDSPGTCLHVPLVRSATVRSVPSHRASRRSGCHRILVSLWPESYILSDEPNTVVE